MVHHAAHQDCVNNYYCNYHCRSFFPALLEENDYGVDARREEGHYQKIYNHLQVGVNAA